MATYKQIQLWVKQQFGFVPQTCWIAHVKELSGLPIRLAPNRMNVERAKPCPPNKVESIREALQHFGMIER